MFLILMLFPYELLISVEHRFLFYFFKIMEESEDRQRFMSE